MLLLSEDQLCCNECFALISLLVCSQASNVGDAASRAGAATGRAVEAAGQKVRHKLGLQGCWAVVLHLQVAKPKMSDLLADPGGCLLPLKATD